LRPGRAAVGETPATRGALSARTSRCGAAAVFGRVPVSRDTGGSTGGIPRVVAMRATLVVAASLTGCASLRTIIASGTTTAATIAAIHTKRRGASRYATTRSAANAATAISAETSIDHAIQSVIDRPSPAYLTF